MEEVTNGESDKYLKEQKETKDSEISGLKRELNELKDMMKILLKGKNGNVS